MQPRRTIACLAELPAMPATIDTMYWNQTGTWRFLTPLPVNKMPPCRFQCPAGMPIPDFINALKDMGKDAALAAIFTHNPLPGLTSRLCYHPCQSKCVRRELDQTISIQLIERHLADKGETTPQFTETPDAGRVAIIGAGPLGLTCAYFLRLNGFDAVMMDAKSEAGGALLNIPSDKLEPQVLVNDIGRLVQFVNLEIQLGQTISANQIPALADQFDAVILDPTSGDTSPPYAGLCTSFNPFDEALPTEKVLAVELPERLLPFRPAMIAHYIGAGHRVANQIAVFLNTGPTDKQHFEAPQGRITKDQMKLDRFTASASGLKKGREWQGEWNLEQVLAEAERCLSCGTCNQCGLCVMFCPDASIQKHRKGVVVDLYHCKGCGICAYECARGVITLEDVNP
jgi:Pyruvate/2-oxoacid:ferredoxin oxidoreductase delta subunit